MSSPVDNNRLEVRPSFKNKRKVTAPLPSVYTNPALDLLADDDRIDNATMEVRLGRKRKRVRSIGEITTFDNTALDLGVAKMPPNQFLVKELENVTRNLKTNNLQSIEDVNQEPIYANLTHLQNSTFNSVDMQITNTVKDSNHSQINSLNQTEIQTNDLTEIPNRSKVVNQIEIPNDTQIPNQIIGNNHSNLNLSFIDRLGFDSTNMSNQSLYLDDDLNESNIMEIKTITIITKKKSNRRKSTNPFLNNSDEFKETDTSVQENPFLKMIEESKSTADGITDTQINIENNIEIQNTGTDNNDDNQSIIPYVDISDNMFDPNGVSIHIDDVSMEPVQPIYTLMPPTDIVPRRLFSSETNSTVSTVNDLSLTNIESQPEYENFPYRSESPIYSNIEEVYAANVHYNKQSKVLGHDVSSFECRDILNLNPRRGRVEVGSTRSLSSNDTSDSKKHDFTHQINKLSKKVLKKIKKTFITDKPDHNINLNPYEVPRKAPKIKATPKEAGFENPALSLNNSDELEDSYEGDHLYETIKTARNTRHNMNVTPLKECNREVKDAHDLGSNLNTSGRKQVRFDSTLNQEKVITGNSFDEDRLVLSPGLDAKIDDFHDELENCMNEKKFIAQIL